MRNLLAHFLAYSTCVALATNASAAQSETTCGDAKLREWASTYKTYRAQRRRDPDLHTQELSDWNGEMHRVMVRLGEELATHRISTACVETILGAPDELRSSGQRHASVVVERGEQHFVYWWRGVHDYLYLVARDAHVVQARWWFAYE